MSCTTLVREFLDERNYNDQRDANLAGRCGVAINFHLITYGESYEYPTQPSDRPILVRAPIHVGGKPFQVLAHLAYAGAEDLHTDCPTLLLDSDLYLVTDADYDQIVQLITQRQDRR